MIPFTHIIVLLIVVVRDRVVRFGLMVRLGRVVDRGKGGLGRVVVVNGLRHVLGRRGDVDRLRRSGEVHRLGRVVGLRRWEDGLLDVGLGRGMVDGLGRGVVHGFRRGVVRLRGGVGRVLVGGVGRVVGSRVVCVVRFGVVGFPGLGGELVGDGAQVLREGRGRQQGRNYLKNKREMSNQRGVIACKMYVSLFQLLKIDF